MSHQIRCSPENKVQTSTEVQELLDKGVIRETQLTPQNFVSQIFLVEKRVGSETSDKLKGSQSIYEDRTLHKIAETSGGFPETKRLSSHNIPRRHANATSGQGPTTIGDPTYLPIMQELGVSGEPEEICTDPNPRDRVSGLPSVLSNNEALDSLREI